MFENYLNIFNIHHENCKIIPPNWGGGTIKEYTISFEGWSQKDSSENFSDVFSFISYTIKNFINFYKEEYAFGQPWVKFFPLHYEKFSMTIKLMPLEDYEYIKNINNENHMDSNESGTS